MHSTSLAVVITAWLLTLTFGQSVDPSTIDEMTKEKWCNDQVSSCPLICLQLPGSTDAPQDNTCDPASLTYSCICSNGQQPNSSEYSQTVPYYECTSAADTCVKNCANGDSACQSACRTSHPCGAQNPTRQNTSTLSTMSATSMDSSPSSSSGSGSRGGQSAGNSYTGFGGAPASTGSTNAARHVASIGLQAGETFGFVCVLGSLFLGFVLL